MGILLSSILNGFGSVSLPHSYISDWYLGSIPRERLDEAERDLICLEQTMEKKKLTVMEVWKMEKESVVIDLSPMSGVTSRQQQPPQSYYCHISRKKERDNNSIEQKIQPLLIEWGLLQDIHEELKETIAEMKSIHSSVEKARRNTHWGKMKKLLGWIFSVILLVRMSVAFSHILMKNAYQPSIDKDVDSSPHKNRSNDIITSSLLFLVGHDLLDDRRYDLVCQCTSLIMTAVLSVSQANRFLTTCYVLNRRLGGMGRRRRRRRWNNNNNLEENDEEFLLLLNKEYSNDNEPGEGAMQYHQAATRMNNHAACLSDCAVTFIMGCYFLSCILLIKMNLPLDYRFAFASSLQEGYWNNDDEREVDDVLVHFNFVVLDFVFVVSAGFSTIALLFLFGVRRQTSLIYGRGIWRDSGESLTREVEV